MPDGRSLPVFVIANSTADRRFLLTNPAEYSLTYNGLVMSAEKRRSRGWQAFGSYTWSRASGLQPSSGATAAGPQVSTIAGTPFLTFGQDPNSLTNAGGRLPNDRPHMLRVMGSVDVPRTGLVVAANVQHFTRQAVGGDDADRAAAGRPAHPARAARIAPAVVANADRSAPLAADLVRRLGRRVELLVDVLNVLNDAAEEGIATDNLFSPNFGQPTAFSDPRRAMVGVRLNLGR